MGFGFMSLCVPIFHPLFSPWTWPLLHPCLDYCRWCCSKLDSSPAGWGLWGHRGRSSSRHSFAQKDSKFSLFNGGGLAAKLCLTLATPWTVVYQASLSVGFPVKNTGVGCHLLLQGITPTRGSNSSLLHWRQALYYWATREAQPLQWQNLILSSRTSSLCKLSVLPVNTPALFLLWVFTWNFSDWTVFSPSPPVETLN